MKAEIPAPFSILFYEIIDTIENLIDSIKKAADLVRILAIKSK